MFNIIGESFSKTNLTTTVRCHFYNEAFTKAIFVANISKSLRLGHIILEVLPLEI